MRKITHILGKMGFREERQVAGKHAKIYNEGWKEYIYKKERQDKMKILYTAEATATGGRGGQVRSSDGALEANLSVPKEMGGVGGEGTNPEQLFAAGYAACFQSALMVAARRQHVDASESTVTGRVGIGPTAGGGFGLEVELHVQLPEVDRSVGEQLVTMAHAVCPYSNATRGNIQVKLFLDNVTVGGD